MPMNATPKNAPEWLSGLPSDYSIIEENIDRYARAAGPHEEWAKIATLSTNFLEGKQWSDEELAILARERRPVVTKNLIAPLFRIIMGYQRQNRYEIKYMPGNDGTGSQEVAKALNATSAQIAERNKQEWRDSEVFQDGITASRGFWDARLDFSRNGLGEVLITNKDPFSIMIDPEAESYDPNAIEGGWGYYLETRWLSPVDIFMLYGADAYDEVVDYTQIGMPANSVDWTNDGQHITAPERYFGLDFFMSDRYTQHVGLYTSPFNHINQYRKLVRVVDSQHKKLRKVNYFYDLETGGEAVIPDTFSREQIARVVEWVRMKNIPLDVRTGYKKMVRWTVTAGNRVLWDNWSPYGEKYTLIPYFPYFRRGKTRGLIEDLIDPQREVNKRASSMLHVIMTTANSGWMWEDNALSEEMERKLQLYGAKPGIHIKYREGFQPPQKITPESAPTSFQNLIVDSKEDLKNISGINDSALGTLDRVQSGRAIQARQKQTIVGAETYFDNFARSRELLGCQLLYLVQTFYTEPRIVKSVVGEGSEEPMWINAKNAAGEIVNNVTMGTYEVAVEEAPVSATFMQGQFQEVLDLINMGVPIPWDIAIELSTMPNKDEIIRRIKEEYGMAMNQNLLANYQQRAAMGIPLEVPMPPIASQEPYLVDMPQQAMAPQQQPQPVGGMLPPQFRTGGSRQLPFGMRPPAEGGMTPTTAPQLGA